MSAHPGDILGHFGAFSGLSWHLDHLCNMLEPFEGHLGAHLGPSWDYRGTILVHLDPSWDVLWLSWGHFGHSCAILKPILGHLGTEAILGESGLS